MKNIVRVKAFLAMPDMVFPISGTSPRRYVFMRMATMNQSMKYGMDIFLLSPLKITDVTRASGMIQSALVSFIVVATSRASSPYAAPAPTTELVSWIAIAAQVPTPAG